jgi:hydrogenase maturation protein HypF
MFQAVEEKEISTIAHMVTRTINAPLTSSIGRLFDGVAAIIGLRYRVSFEGQAAMDVEMAADRYIEDHYQYAWSDDQPMQIDTRPIIQGIVEDMRRRVELSIICGRFHRTLIVLFTELCESLRKTTGVNQIALSGGVFQNRILFQGLCQALRKKQFEVLCHAKVPCNDGGISLGQAVIAAARMGDHHP